MKRFALLLATFAGCASSHARDALPNDVAPNDAAIADFGTNHLASNQTPIRDAGSKPESSSASDQSVSAPAADAAMHAEALPPNDAGTHYAAAPPPDLHQSSTVWIGEVEKTVTYPGDISHEFTPQRVVLILDAVHDMATGTITFGVDPLPQPQATDTFYPPDADNDDVALQTSEPQPPSSDPGVHPTGPQVCKCHAGKCHAMTDPQRHIDLKISGEAIEGELSGLAGGGLNDQPIIRLRRVQ